MSKLIKIRYEEKLLSDWLFECVSEGIKDGQMEIVLDVDQYIEFARLRETYFPNIPIQKEVIA